MCHKNEEILDKRKKVSLTLLRLGFFNVVFSRGEGGTLTLALAPSYFKKS